MIIEPGLFLVTWIFPTESIPLCLCRSVEDAKAVVKEKLGYDAEWYDPPDDVKMWLAHLGLTDGLSNLQGVMIQQVPIYKVGHAVEA